MQAHQADYFGAYRTMKMARDAKGVRLSNFTAMAGRALSRHNTIRRLWMPLADVSVDFRQAACLTIAQRFSALAHLDRPHFSGQPSLTGHCGTWLDPQLAPPSRS
jgi:hypothetical protein